MNTMTEILTILQEEAAEVIQIASKIHRFGYHSDNMNLTKIMCYVHYKTPAISFSFKITESRTAPNTLIGLSSVT